MNIFQIILTVITALCDAFLLIFDICLLISWLRAKEKAFITNWTGFIYVLLGFSIFTTSHERLYGWLFLVMVVLMILSQFTCISPEGVRLPIFIKGGIDPVDNYSYEYSKNDFGHEVLLLYNKNGKSGLPYNIGIKKPKTVKMLADWYGKHNYENPLTK